MDNQFNISSTINVKGLSKLPLCNNVVYIQMLLVIAQHFGDKQLIIFLSTGFLPV